MNEEETKFDNIMHCVFAKGYQGYFDGYNGEISPGARIGNHLVANIICRCKRSVTLFGNGDYMTHLEEAEKHAQRLKLQKGNNVEQCGVTNCKLKAICTKLANVGHPKLVPTINR